VPARSPRPLRRPGASAFQLRPWRGGGYRVDPDQAEGDPFCGPVDEREARAQVERLSDLEVDAESQVEIEVGVVAVAGVERGQEERGLPVRHELEAVEVDPAPERDSGGRQDPGVEFGRSQPDDHGAVERKVGLRVVQHPQASLDAQDEVRTGAVHDSSAKTEIPGAASEAVLTLEAEVGTRPSGEAQHGAELVLLEGAVRGGVDGCKRCLSGHVDTAEQHGGQGKAEARELAVRHMVFPP
jgi:hypothetical protein